MATSTRQFGRRALSNAPGATSNNNASTGNASVPPRRYVLDVPTSRISRSSRASAANRMTDEYDLSNMRSRSAGAGITYSTLVSTGYNDENGEQLSRSGSRDYYYRDGNSESSSASVTRYLDDPSIRQLLDSGTNYSNTLVDDQEVQQLTARATPDVRNYPINVDSNPELIVRPNTNRLTYTQDIAVRYLRPNTPPPPGPIIIREIRAPAPPPAPPMILRQRPPPPRTPSPVIIREKPPARPKSVPTTVIKKVIPPPPPPPRKLIIERLPNLPPKPRPVIIERWLPYHRQKRQVVHEKAKPLEPRSRIKNTIIEWRPPEVEVVKHVKKLGVQQADPQRYYTQYGDKLYATEFVQRKLTELGLQEELALMQEQQTSVAREDVALEQADQYNVRQILNGYDRSSSSRQIYTTNASSAVTHLTRSSSYAGALEDYGDQEQTLYDRSPSTPLLTEDILLRSHATNGGKFPSHLLTKLGSQVYEMPSDHVDLTSRGRRTTTATTSTRYYTTSAGEGGYESTADETGENGSRYADDKYVQIKASDLKDVLANYDLVSSTGEKLDGEQLTF